MPVLRFDHPLPHQPDWPAWQSTRQSNSSSSRGRPPAAADYQDDAGRGDDAPMTPVVYIVLWCSVSLGVLRGYILTDTVAARQTPSYTRTFDPRAHMLPLGSAFCATGVDGLPGISWYEMLIDVLPMLAPILGAGFVMKRGRKMGIVLGCWLAIIGQLLLASAVKLVQLYIGNALVRSASDIVYLSVGLQDIEIASRTSRGSFLLVHMLGVAMGSCMSAVLGLFVSDQPALGWRLMFGIGVLPAAAVLCVVPYAYETPHSLIQRGEFAAGWVALKEVRGPFYDAYPEYEGIVAAAARMPSSAAMYLQLLTRRVHRPAFFMGVIMALLSSLLNPATMTYVAYSAFRRANYKLRVAVFVTNICIYASYAVGVFIAVLLVDVAGRLPLLRVSSFISTTSLLAMVILHKSKVHMPGSDAPVDRAFETGEMEEKWAWLQLIILCVLAGGNGLAWSTSAWAIIMESQALPVRPAGVAVCIAATGLAVVLIEGRVLCAIGINYYGLLLGFSTLSMVIAFFLVPETAKVPLEHVTSLWLNHCFYSRFFRTRQLAQQVEAGDALVPLSSLCVLRGQALAAAAAQAVATYKNGGASAVAACERDAGGDVILGLRRYSSNEPFH